MKKAPAATDQVNYVNEDPSGAPLLDVGAAALDEDTQHDQKQDTGDNTNDGGIVHFDFLSFRR